MDDYINIEHVLTGLEHLTDEQKALITSLVDRCNKETDAKEQVQRFGAILDSAQILLGTMNYNQIPAAISAKLPPACAPKP